MSKQATRDERLQIHTLAASALKPRDIAEKMGFTEGRVYYLLKAPVTTPKAQRTGQKSSTAQKKRRLINFIIESPANSK